MEELEDIDSSYRIIVNGRDHSWHKETISYSDAVDLAIGKSQNHKAVYTVIYNYKKSMCCRVCGSMIPGSIIDIVYDMEINVYLTNNG